MQFLRDAVRRLAYWIIYFFRQKLPGMYAREVTRVRLKRSTPPLVRLVNFNGARFSMVIPGRGTIENAILASNSWSGDLLMLSDHFVVPGDTIIEVGANIGYESLYYAAKYPACTVHAYEPATYGYENLMRSRSYSRLTNLHVHKLGVGDISGEFTLSIPTASSCNKGLGSFLKNRDVETTYTTEQVPVVRLDEHLQDPGRVTLVKIDTQGFELPVLRGAKQLIARNRPVVIFEFEDHYHDRHLEVRGELAEFWDELGYQLFMVGGENLIPLSLREATFVHTDVVALPGPI